GLRDDRPGRGRKRAGQSDRRAYGRCRAPSCRPRFGPLCLLEEALKDFKLPRRKRVFEATEVADKAALPIGEHDLMLDHEIDCVGDRADILSPRRWRQSRQEDLGPRRSGISAKALGLPGGSDDLAVMGRTHHAEELGEPFTVETGDAHRRPPIEAAIARAM